MKPGEEKEAEGRPPRRAARQARARQGRAATPAARRGRRRPRQLARPAAPSQPRRPEMQYRSVGPGGFIRQGPGDQQAPIPPAPPRRLVPAKPSPEVADKTSLLDLNDRVCQWPMGHPGEPDFHFCGQAVQPRLPLLRRSIAASPIRRSCRAATAVRRRRCRSADRGCAVKRAATLSENSPLKWWRAPMWTAGARDRRQELCRQPDPRLPAQNRRGLHVARLKLAHRIAWSPAPPPGPAVPAAWRDRSTATATSRPRFPPPPSCSPAARRTAPGRVRHPRAPAGQCRHPPRRDRPGDARQIPELRRSPPRPALASPPRLCRATRPNRSIIHPDRRHGPRRGHCRPAARAPRRHLPSLAQGVAVPDRRVRRPGPPQLMSPARID